MAFLLEGTNYVINVVSDRVHDYHNSHETMDSHIPDSLGNMGTVGNAGNVDAAGNMGKTGNMDNVYAADNVDT